MPILDTIRATLASIWGYGSGSGGGYHLRGQWLPGTKVDFTTEAGRVWLNSVVALGVKWIGDRVSRPIMRQSIIAKRGGNGVSAGDYIPLPRSPIVDLWARPNPYYTRRALEKAVALSLICDGNAYIRKLRDAAGRVVELWWMPHFRIAPYWETGSQNFIDGYRMDGIMPIPKEDIIHIRDGFDPDNMRVGLSAMGAQLREVCTVNESSTYTASILKNGGVPGLVVTPANDSVRPSPEDAASMKKRIKETVSGDNRGEALIMTAPFNVTSPAFSPQQLSLEDLPDPAIARIAGAIGTPPMVLGLPDPGKTYSNLEEAIRSAWGVIVSLQELVADSLRWDLFPDFGIDPQANVIEYDYSQIQEYQESLDAMWGRIGEAYKNGIITRNEGRELIGYDADPDGDVYYPGTGGGAEPKAVPGFPPQGAASPPGAIPQAAVPEAVQSSGNGQPAKWWGGENRLPFNEKFNPYHGPDGRFASGGHGAHGGGGRATGTAVPLSLRPGGAPPKPAASGGGGGGAAASHATESMKEPSKAKVEVHPAAGLSEKQARAHVDSMFGRKVEDHELASIVGAPHDAKVNIIKASSGEVHMSWRSPDAWGKRSITKEADGLHMHNVQLEVTDKGHGLGRDIFGKQVHFAEKAGIKSIHADATREPGMNGHYTWPRFGYDGKIPANVKLPDQFKGAKNVSDLMKTKEGATFWKSKGKTFEATFELGSNSHSMKVWNGYLKEKAGA